MMDGVRPVRGEPGSFARAVLERRHPVLLDQVTAARPWPPHVRSALARLAAELSDERWFEVPFLDAEVDFYRRLLAATDWSGTGPWAGVDPFGPAKAAELAGDAVTAELAALDELEAAPPPPPAAPGELDDRLAALLLSALWGNRADLGFRLHAPTDPATGPTGSTGSPGSEGSGGSGLLVDDRAALAAHLPGPGGSVTLLADNAGRELLPDLVLADHLLSAGRAGSVVLQVKPCPWFVSDATTADVLAALDRMRAAGGAAGRVGDRLWAALTDGHLAVRAHPFLAAAAPFADMPDDLRAELTPSKITLVKGDLNYRRLVGDRHRPVTSSFADLTAGFPGPVAALRTLKSDVVVGLDEATAARLEGIGAPDAEGRSWRNSGRYAVIQLAPGR